MARKHGFHSTHIEHHHDGSATVHHRHKDGEHKDVKHAVRDLDDVHDSLEEHLGEPNEGEGEEPVMHGQPGMPAGVVPGGAGPQGA